ncbi:hypothetical protein E2C01_000485 [Portunus trituberculatus]|uniref:Uncharacterized protein n=1 Tax=Portunus trituberculatus TaxID=210409 RepID=A0A5B7CET1_PORTR|nr:hypothetical protein [Portunus trituberculatus]
MWCLLVTPRPYRGGVEDTGAGAALAVMMLSRCRRCVGWSGLAHKPTSVNQTLRFACTMRHGRDDSALHPGADKSAADPPHLPPEISGGKMPKCFRIAYYPYSEVLCSLTTTIFRNH